MERNVFGGNEIYLEGTKSIWREQNLFGGNKINLEGTMLILRERNVFLGNEIYFEGTKCIWKDRNIFRWNEIISQNSHMSLQGIRTLVFRGSVSGSVVKVGQSLILP